MIFLYTITVAIVFGKDMLKIMTGPECKQSKNIEKNSQKSRDLQILKKLSEKKEMLDALDLSFFYYSCTF